MSVVAKKCVDSLQKKTEMRRDELSPQATSGTPNTPGLFSVRVMTFFAFSYCQDKALRKPKIFGLCHCGFEGQTRIFFKKILGWWGAGVWLSFIITQSKPLAKVPEYCAGLLVIYTTQDCATMGRSKMKRGLPLFGVRGVSLHSTLIRSFILILFRQSTVGIPTSKP